MISILRAMLMNEQRIITIATYLIKGSRKPIWKHCKRVDFDVPLYEEQKQIGVFFCYRPPYHPSSAKVKIAKANKKRDGKLSFYKKIYRKT